MAGDNVAIDTTTADALIEASDLWWAAEYTRCLKTLERADPTFERFFIQARASYRLNRCAEAIIFLNKGEALAQNHDQRAKCASFAAILLTLSGRHAAAQNQASRARYFLASASPDARCETLLNVAFTHWLNDRISEAEQVLQLADFTRNANYNATALGIRGWLAARRGAYGEQGKFLVSSLRASLQAPALDVGCIANTSHLLAALCRELYIPDALPLVASTLKALPWTADTRQNHFQTLRCLAWAQSLQGEYISAIRLLYSAESLASDRYWHMLGLLDRAWIATISKEALSAQAALSEADEIARTLDWSPTCGEECAILLVAAELFAGVNPQRSQELLRTFQSVKNNISANYGFAHDERLTAHYEYALACALYESNAVATSRRHAKRAYEIFLNAGYCWRAARCALLLYRSGLGSSWLSLANEHIGNYPRSFVAEEVRAANAALHDASVGERLTPRRREILILLCDGMSIEQIAQQLGSSVNTVKVHIQRLYRDFGVKNRVQLLNKASRK